MAVKMIALDLDGTTLNSEGKLSDFTRETLEKAINKGIYVVVCTGRAFSSLPAEILRVKGLRYTITSNGAIITDLKDNSIIYGDYLDENAVRESVRIASENKLMIEGFWGGNAYLDADFYREVEEHGCFNRNREYVLSTRKPIENLYEEMERNVNRIENINFFFPNYDLMEEMRPLIEGIPNAMTTSSFSNNIEVGGPDTCKRKAIAAFGELFGISQEEIMCCGDAPNDIEMIKYAGIGVAMGNAWGGTKDYADYVTDTNDDDGVAKAIIKFAL